MGGLATKSPVNPPLIKKLIIPRANNIAGVNTILPRHKVVIQLNVFMEDGTAIINDVRLKTEPKNGFIPATNI